MTFRTRLLLACLPLALAPLAFFGLRARGEVTARLGEQHAERVEALARVIEEDLARESRAVAARLDRVAESMAADNRFRLAVLAREQAAGEDRAYVLDYAERAMPLAGLDMLRVQDRDGRVLSSGHFRNEYDAVDPALPAALGDAGGRATLVSARTPSGPLLALALARPLAVGADTLTLVGGTAVDARFLDRLARGTGLDVRLHAGDAELATATTPGDAAPGAAHGHAREVVLRLAGAGPDSIARFVVRASDEPLVALRRDMDRWLLATAAAATVLALLLAALVSARLAAPLAALARKAGRVDLDRLDVRFGDGRADEVGALSRVLDRMTHRLRASAARLRDAERRAATGDLARQVHHDVRNGLIPIRNVVSHLAELARERPDKLPAVFLERQGTLESSVEYLHSMAANYARLSPGSERRPCDVNRVAREAAGDALAAGESNGRAAARLDTDLAPDLPPVHADPVALRRVLDNLVVNALESLDGGSGRVVVWTRLDRSEGRPRVLLGVSDEGRGMTPGERARIFDDFYTTRPGGTGLGLSIVRRLVTDLDGRIEVESAPGSGTRVTVALPAAAPSRDPDAAAARTTAPRDPEPTR